MHEARDDAGDLMGRPDAPNPNDDEPTDLRLSREMIRELVKIRKKQKIGQDEIAEAMGVGQSRISQIERAHRNVHLETVLGYAKAIGCRIVIERKPRGKANGEELDALQPTLENSATAIIDPNGVPAIRVGASCRCANPFALKREGNSGDESRAFYSAPRAQPNPISPAAGG